MTAPSSTSSSRRPIPSGRWLRDWGRAVLLSAGILVALEIQWRTLGFFPTVPDTPEIWALERAAVQPESTVFAGSSMTQAAIDLETWRRETGEDVRQLSIVGSSIGPTLIDLIDDPDFRGTIVAEYIASLFALDTATQKSARRFIERGRRALAGPAETIEAQLTAGLRARATLGRAELSPLEVYRGFLEADRPRPGRFRMGADRQLSVFFDPAVSGPPMPTEAELENAPRYSREELLERVARLETLTAPLRARGGRLIFLRPPTTGGIRAREDAVFPDDEILAALGNIPGAIAVDTRPRSGFPSFDTVDGSHLAAKDAPAFTREVLARLGRRPSTGVHDDGS